MFQIKFNRTLRRKYKCVINSTKVLALLNIKVKFNKYYYLLNDFLGTRMHDELKNVEEDCISYLFSFFVKYSFKNLYLEASRSYIINKGEARRSSCEEERERAINCESKNFPFFIFPKMVIAIFFICVQFRWAHLYLWEELRLLNSSRSRRRIRLTAWFPPVHECPIKKKGRKPHN